MTERSDPRAADAIVGPHGKATDHGSTDGHDDHGHDDHGHDGGEALGPMDARAWGAAVLGIALGLAVAVAFLASTGI